MESAKEASWVSQRVDTPEINDDGDKDDDTGGGLAREAANAARLAVVWKSRALTRIEGLSP